MKEAVSNSVYRDRVTGQEYEVKRITTTDYKVLIEEEWVPMKYSQLKKQFTFVHKKINYSFNHKETAVKPYRRKYVTN